METGSRAPPDIIPVAIEAKFGKNPRLNPGNIAKGGNNPAQMSQKWIEKNIREMEAGSFKTELQDALQNGKIKGMVVTTKYNANGVIQDPEFVEKLWGAIGQTSW